MCSTVQYVRELFGAVQNCSMVDSTAQFCTIRILQWRSVSVLFSMVQYWVRLDTFQYSSLYIVSQHCTVHSNIIQYYSVLRSTAQYCSLLFSAAQHCLELCDNMQICTELYTTAPSNIIQYCATLLNAIGCCTIQLSTIRYHRIAFNTLRTYCAATKDCWQCIAIKGFAEYANDCSLNHWLTWFLDDLIYRLHHWLIEGLLHVIIQFVIHSTN